VRERSGDADAARKEAVASLERMPSIEAYLVMGRLDLAAGDLDRAAYHAREALKIDPAAGPPGTARQIEASKSRKK